MTIQEALRNAMTIDAPGDSIIIARNNDDEYVLREFASGNTFLNIEDLLADDWFVEVQR